MDIKSWEQAYLENFTPWDRGEASPPLVDWLAGNTLRGSVLVPGCGMGHDAALLAAHGLDVTGLDIAPTAVERARHLHPDCKGRFVCDDFFAHQGCYDIIVEHTCLSALPPEMRPAYRDTMARLLRPGGLLVGVWFVNPQLDPGETGPPFGISPEELEALFAADFEIVESRVPGRSYPGREGRELLRVMRRRG